MATKKAAAQQVVAAQEEAPEMAVVATEAEAPVVTEEAQEEVAEKVKRERNYSQSAIDKDDLERLNGLKTLIKDKMKLNVSNQRILSAALDCLGENVEAFLQKLADEVNERQKAKDLKQLEELKKKLNVE